MFWKCAGFNGDINSFTTWVYLLASIFHASSYGIFTEFIVINLFEVDCKKNTFYLPSECISLIFTLIALINFFHWLRTGVYWGMLISLSLEFSRKLLISSLECTFE